MNYTALIPLAAAIVNIVVLSYVAATGMRTRASRAYGLFIGAILLWEVTDFILLSYPPPAVALGVSRASLLFHLTPGLLYCNLIMSLMERRRTGAFHVLTAVTIAALLTALSTGLFYGYEPTAGSYGIRFMQGPLYEVIVMTALFAPVSYCLYLLLAPGAEAGVAHALTAGQRRLLIWFSLLVLIPGIILNLVLPRLVTHEHLPPLVSSLSAFIVLFIHAFIVKYRLFRDHIHAIAYELFSRINDCILIFDRNETIIEINRPARELLGLVSRPIAGIRASNIFPPGHSLHEEYSGREMTLTVAGRPKSILVTQTGLVAGEPDAGRLVILKDVSDRRAAERALIASEAEYRATVDSLESFLCVIDSDLRVVLINRAMTTLLAGLGIDPATFTGKPFYQVLPFLDDAECRGRILGVMEGGDPLVIEEPRVIGGRDLVVELRIVPIIEFNTVTRVTLTITDISQRKKVEEALRVSEEKFFKAFNASPIAMAINALQDGRYVDVNESQVEQSGYSRDEFLGHTIFDLDIFADADEFKRFASLLQKNRKVRTFPCRMRIKSGEVLDGVISAEIIQFYGIDYVISATVNISDLKRAEKKILEQYAEIQEQYRVLALMNDELTHAHTDVLEINRILAREKERLTMTLRSIGEGVITIDATGRIEIINNIAATIVGREAADAVGQPVEQVLPIVNERTGLTCRQMVDAVITTGTIVEMRFNTAMIAPDGERKYISAIGSPIRDQGVVDGAILAFRDVTDRKRIEEELFKTSKIESLGVFAGGIAHDFNNLLTAILGNASLGRLSLDNRERVGEILSAIETATERARDLTLQLLTFSKGGAPIRQAVSLKELLSDTVRFALAGSPITARYRISDDLWDAEVDAGQISQVIHNLVLNACEAMPGRGTIEIRAANRIIGEDDGLPLAPGTYLQISVIDDGHGIDESTLKNIFDPFFTTKVNGTGLGLAVAYSIIRRHDGHIAVSSQLNAGTTFTLYLPATGDRAPLKHADTAAVLRGSGRILLMDDEQMILDVGSRMIRRLGYHVDTAATGEEAIDRYRSAREQGAAYDAIIMDLTIRGGMGGREAVALLAAYDPEVVAIVSSGYSNDPVMADYRRFGFTDVVTKPYRLEELALVLDRVLTSNGKKSAKGPS